MTERVDALYASPTPWGGSLKSELKELFRVSGFMFESEKAPPIINVLRDFGLECGM